MRKVLSAVTLGAALLAGATDAEAQRRFGAGISAGVSIPVSDLSESHKFGYNAAAHVGINVPGLPLALRLEGFYTNLGPRAESIIGDGDFRIAGGNVNLVYNVSAMGFRPYLIGGVGFYNVKHIRGSTTHAGFNAGLGTKLQLAGFGTFAEARLHMIRDERRFKFVPITFGIEF